MRTKTEANFLFDPIFVINGITRVEPNPEVENKYLYYMRFLVECREKTNLIFELRDSHENSINTEWEIIGVQVVEIDCTDFMEKFNWENENIRRIFYKINGTIGGSFPLVSPDYKGDLRIVCVSGNSIDDDGGVTFYPSKDKKIVPTLWNVVTEKRPDLILHIGDQIYGDDIFDKRSGVPDEHKIYQSYANLYRTSYSNYGQGLAMRHSLNAMIMDNHDIHKLMGTPGTRYNLNNTVFKPFWKEGMRAYLDYQHSLTHTTYQLHDLYLSGQKPIYYKLDLGRFCIIVLDERNELFHHGTVLTQEQISWVEDILDRTSKQDIIIVSSRPIAHMNWLMAYLDGVLNNSGKDEMLHPNNYQQTVQLIDILSRHLIKRFVIVSGHMHRSYIQHIKKNDMLIATNIVSSPISQVSKACAPLPERISYAVQQELVSYDMGEIIMTRKQDRSDKNSFTFIFGDNVSLCTGVL